MNKIAKLLTSSLLIIALLSGVAMGQTSPINETFSNIGTSGSYGEITWTGDDGGTWTATDAREDQSINGKAITVRNGILTSPLVAGGIGNLTITTQRKFTGGDGNMDVRVNGTSVGSVPYSEIKATTTIPNINISGDVTVVIDATNSSKDRVAMDDLKWTAYAGGPPPPFIILNPTSLSGFSYVVGSGPSAEKTFSVTGSNLTADISLTAPTNYEISKTSSAGFASSLSLTQSGGDVAETIYVRLKAGLPIADYNNETITASSTDANNKTVTCSGSVETAWDYRETFDNSNATGSYSADSFVGDNGITWSYVASRDGNGDANNSGINLPALMLRRSSDNSAVTSSSISGGISDFSVKLYKGFTGGGDRQVELFINGVSKGTSATFDDYDEHIFTVKDINIIGNVVIKLVNTKTTQVIVDDISWNSYDGATPITLASFTASANAGVVELAWETASETNNAQFVIYRNDDVLATVEGAGTTSETNNYVYVDETVVPGVAYTYVLADVDYANNETRYDDDAVTVTVGEDLAEADFVIGAAYPNPFNPTAIVPLTLARDANVTAKIYSLTGREIATLVNGTMSAGYHDLQINASDMTTGLYIVRVVVGDVVDVQKIAYLK